MHELAKKLAGNWKKFDSFSWFEQPEHPEQYALVYTHNRDSDILDISNASVIAERLAPFSDAIPQVHNHWAVGWVEGFAIRVFKDGNITEAFKTYYECLEAMEDYPILDESDYSQRLYEAQQESWDSWARHDFERLIEKRFPNYTVNDIDGLFSHLAEKTNTDWELDSIDLDRIVKGATTKDVKKFSK